MTGRALFRRFLPRLGLFGKADNGSATLEFIILMPAFMLIFLSTFELGMLMTRHVMLGRGLDLVVREVRLGAMDGADHDDLVAAICDNLVVMENCRTDLKLEMRQIDPRVPAPIPAAVDCVDRADPGLPPGAWSGVARNQLMILRACALFDPIFPTTGLGASLPRQSGGAYALLASSSYVVEP